MMNERRQTLITLCFFLVQNSNLVVFIIIISTDYRNAKARGLYGEARLFRAYMVLLMVLFMTK